VKYILIFILLLLIPNNLKSQPSGHSGMYETEVETFMGMLDSIFSDEMIDEITYMLPDNLSIINFSVGDYSGDTLNDIVISYKEKTCPKQTYKVIFLINSGDTFLNAGFYSLKWRNTPYDISFVIKNGMCSFHIEVENNEYFPVLDISVKN